MARISQHTIDLIKDTADIVDVVSEFVPLQTAGKNMKGLCPFHSEKTPSFFVSKERQIFNCFGCGKKGDSIKFIQEYKHLSYVDAVTFLANKYHIDIDIDQTQKTSTVKQNLFQANQKALAFYTLHLLHMEEGKEALDYLVKRGLDIDTIKAFDLGYAPKKSDALYAQLSQEFQLMELLNAGLVNQNERGPYDLFRKRIMFPIKDEFERVVGFSGRIFDARDTQAKYVNTAATEIFTKSDILYNLHQAIPHIQRNQRVVLMEGFMDVIKANLAGVKETVCSMGTQLTIEQARKLKKYTDKVIICYDGDRAGKEATYKAIKKLEAANLEVDIALMPDGLDPDEFISTHPNFQAFLDDQLLDQYEFVYRMIVSDKDLTIPIQIEKAKQLLFDFFRQTSGTIRDIYFHKFSADALISMDVLQADYLQTKINERINQTFKNSVRKAKRSIKTVPKYKKAEEVIINYYMHDEIYRTVVDDVYDSILFSQQEYIGIILTAMDVHKVYTKEDILVPIKTTLASEKHKETLDRLLFDEAYVYTQDEFSSCIRTLKIAKLEDSIADIEDKVSQLDQTNPEDKQLFKTRRNEILHLKKRIDQLRRQS